MTPDIIAILEEAPQAARASYREAVASLVEGRVSDEWLNVRRVIARAHLLALLVGASRVYSAAVIRGASLDLDGPPVQPAKFSKFADGSGDDFITGEFLEAVRSFDGKVPRLAETVARLSILSSTLANAIVDAEREGFVSALVNQSSTVSQMINNSFWVSGVDQKTTLNLRALLAGVIRGDIDGETAPSLPDFIDRAHLSGAANLTDARLETIYRTNVLRAYNDGQADALSSPDVAPIIPLAMVDEIRDARTRPTHKRFDGYINTVSEIRRKGIVPPNGFNCRATLVPVTTDRAESLGLLTDGRPDPIKISVYNGEREGMLTSGEYPDQGFR